MCSQCRLWFGKLEKTGLQINNNRLIIGFVTRYQTSFDNILNLVFSKSYIMHLIIIFLSFICYTNLIFVLFFLGLTWRFPSLP